MEGDHTGEAYTQAEYAISIHALRVEGDQVTLSAQSRRGNFYPRPPGGGRQAKDKDHHPDRSNFYPRPPGGGRLISGSQPPPRRYFYPRPPGGGRLLPAGANGAPRMRFLSTPSGWRATRFIDRFCRACGISIHALRVEGDINDHRGTTTFSFNFYPRPPGGGRPASRSINRIRMRYFYPRPPGGGRRVARSKYLPPPEFLSTPSGWRATTDTQLYGQGRQHFYPRPPGGGRQAVRRRKTVEAVFLSTPSGWRATGKPYFFSGEAGLFLSTPSGWRATIVTVCRLVRAMISIHALRVEGDQQRFNSREAGANNFYPRPPGGGRPSPGYAPHFSDVISIHALRVEGDFAGFMTTV